MLVNKEYALSDEYDRKLRKICNKRLQASERLYADLTTMLHAGEEAGYSYWIASAYRSRECQQALINQDVQKLVAQGMSKDDALAKTGISYEPWHFRYVGVQAAEFITRHGLTLEQFCRLASSQ